MRGIRSWGPARFLDRRPRHAYIGEQPIIKFEKLLVLALPFPRLCHPGQPRKRDRPGLDKDRNRGGSCVERFGRIADDVGARHGFTSVVERNNAWLQELIRRLSKARVSSLSCPRLALK